jgi:hypothetical protein
MNAGDEHQERRSYRFDLWPTDNPVSPTEQNSDSIVSGLKKKVSFFGHRADIPKKGSSKLKNTSTEYKYEGILSRINAIITEAKTRYFSPNDILMLSLHPQKEQRPNNGLSQASCLDELTEVIKFLGRTKLQLEKELELLTTNQAYKYEQEIENLEKKLKLQLRSEMQVKLLYEDAKRKLDECQRQLSIAANKEVFLSQENSELRKGFGSM